MAYVNVQDAGMGSPVYNIAPPHLGESPVRMVCPNCRSEVLTKVSTECTAKQHIICCLMFITVCCTICSCLPYCCNNCKNYRHSCPQCKMHIGTYTP